MSEDEGLEFDSPLEEEVDAIGVPSEKRKIYTELGDPEIESLHGVRYSSHLPANSASQPSVLKTNLNADEYFLLGDNTDRANDSRFFGPIKRAKILGKVIRIEPTNPRYGVPPPVI